MNSAPPHADAASSGPWILGIDISAPGGRAALYAAGKQETIEVPLAASQPGARALLPAVAKLLDSARIQKEDLAAIGVALGPGSFTGLRIGVSTGKGIAQGLGRPLHGISSMEAMARGARDRLVEAGRALPEWLLPYRDARHGEVFTALFGPLRSGACPREMEDNVRTPEDVPLPAEGKILFLSGEEDAGIMEKFPAPAGRSAHMIMGPAPGAVAKLVWEAIARGVPEAAPEMGPFYHRRPRAETEWEEK